MEQTEAINILKSTLAKYAVKYPTLMKRISGFMSTHPDKDMALAIVITKLTVIDEYIEWVLKEELDIDNTNNRKPL